MILLNYGKYFAAAIFGLLLSCSSPDTQSNETQNEPNAQPKVAAADTITLDLPRDAVRQKHEGNEKLESVTVTDNQGNIIFQGTLINGKKVGSWVEFNSNGSAKKITSYVNGKKEGWLIELNTTGQFTKKVLYRDNLRHGSYREYNYTTLKEERFYQNDKLEGSVKLYYDNGKIMEEGNYVNGTREGVSKWYDQNGNKTIEYTYKNGELVKN
jgi:antitoxin component YwqK of YwqJK toxin-antitoxin module